MARIRERSTTDLLILLIGATICIAVLGTGAAIAVIEITDPTVDTTAAVNAVSDLLNTLVGLLAGFLAGRTEQQRVHREREADDGAA